MPSSSVMLFVERQCLGWFAMYCLYSIVFFQFLMSFEYMSVMSDRLMKLFVFALSLWLLMYVKCVLCVVDDFLYSDDMCVLM